MKLILQPLSLFILTNLSISQSTKLYVTNTHKRKKETLIDWIKYLARLSPNEIESLVEVQE